MAVKRFEDLIAWQKSQEYAVNIYKFSNNVKDFGFNDQIRRASISISNNIAEGFDRKSNTDFIRFLYFSISSCSETRSMLYLAKKLNYANSEAIIALLSQSEEISKILHGLINSLKTNS